MTKFTNFQALFKIFFLSSFIYSSSYAIKLCDSSSNYISKRVIGGQIVDGNEFPWQAVYVSFDSPNHGMMCGATVIDSHFLLTAAHCIMNGTTRAYVLLVGRSSLRDPNHTLKVRRVFVYPGYNAVTVAGDIALVETYSNLISNGAETICLTRNDGVLIRMARTGIVTGFGLHLIQDETGFSNLLTSSDIVLATNVPIMSSMECRSTWKKLSFGSVRLSMDQLCAGSFLHGTAPGDSGGPLVVRDQLGQYVQVGITSFGASGLEGLVDQETYPGVYTRVSSYIDWIEAITNSKDSIKHLSSMITLLMVAILIDYLVLL